MGLFDRLLKSTTTNSYSDSKVNDFAAEHIDEFKNNFSTEKLDRMSENLIRFAKDCWDSGDFDGYMKLLSADEETSYMYQGDKYSHELVEELVRNCH